MRIFKTVGLLVLAIGFPLLFPNPAVTTIAVFTLLFVAATTGWNIFSGYTGYIAHEYRPTPGRNPMEGLEAGIQVLDV